MSELSPLSVIICTRNRPGELARALLSVAQNSGADFEVVVVDQSDGGETADVVRRLQGQYQNVRYFPVASRGLSLARNFGVSQASGSVLAFTDDDCEVGKEWVSRIAGVFAAEPGLGILFGQVFLSEGPAAEALVPCMRLSSRRQLTRGTVAGMGANMAFRRGLFERIEGFDSLLGAGGLFEGGEDYDFLYRAQRAGYSAMADPSVELVHHMIRKSLHWRTILYGYARGDAAFHSKHARCLDVWAMVWILRKGAASLRELARVLWLRQSSDWSCYLRGYWHGLWHSLRHSIDRRTRLYRVQPW